MPIRLIALDIDGTLTDSHQQLAPRTIAAAHAAREAGLRLVLATGRRHDYAWPIAQALGFAPDDVLITSTGTVVRQFDGTLLERTPLGPKCSLALAAALDAHRDTLVYTFDDVDEPAAGQFPDQSLLMETTATLDRVIPRWMEFNRHDIALVRPVEDGLRGREPIQAMVCGTVEGMRRVHAELKAHPVSEHLVILRTEYRDRDIGFMDILPVGVGKGVALARLGESLGVARGEIAAIGDNHNDLDMLRFAGRAFVVANASVAVMEEAQAKGWHCADSHDNCGAAQVLEMLADEALAGASVASGG